MRWCVLRGERELQQAGGDVDLLVHPADLPALRTLLGRAGLEELRAWGRWPHRFFVAPDLKLDVVTALAFGPDATLRTDAAEPMLARSAHGRPAPADAFWALLLHALLDRGAVRPSHASELQGLASHARDAPSPLRPYVEAACPAGWVADEAAAGRFEELLGLALELRAHWPGRSPVARAARARLRGGLRLASRRLPPRPRPRAQHNGAITSNRAARSTG